MSVVLAAAGARPHVLPKVTNRSPQVSLSDGALRAAITEDVAPFPKGDDYLMRLHTSTVLRAVREMQSK